MRAKAPLVPLDTYDADLEKLLAKTEPKDSATAGRDCRVCRAVGLTPAAVFGSPAVLKTLAGRMRQ